MACCLTLSTTSKEDFLGAVGCRVTVKLKAPTGVGAEIVHIRYAGDQLDKEEPFQFDIVKAANMLVVLVEASKPGALLQLVEDCGSGSQQVLDRFHFDPMNPARGYIVRGS